MGDRGNIAVRSGYENGKGEAVFLYSHWGGSELPEIARTVLKREQRWDDAEYLARMVFEEMIKDELGSVTGYGISTNMGDNEHPICVLDVQRERVVFLTEAEYRANGFESLTTAPGLSFREYVEGIELTEAAGA